MKHHLHAALLSALGPGLGQFANQRYFKGGVHLAAFNLLIALVAVLLVKDCWPIWQDLLFYGANPWSEIRDCLRARDLLSYLLLFLAVAIMWLYSIFDAYRDGKCVAPVSQ